MSASRLEVIVRLVVGERRVGGWRAIAPDLVARDSGKVGITALRLRSGT